MIELRELRLKPDRALLLVLAVTLLTFIRVPTAEFVRWDDRWTLHQNPRLNPPTLSHVAAYWREWDRGEFGLYVPVTTTLWSGLAAVGRVDPPDLAGISLNPWIFHGANLLLHLISAALVFQILHRLFLTTVAAMLGAMLFAVHPVQVEPVAWASGLKDVLSGTLAFAAILSHIAGIQRNSRATHVAAIVFTILATLAKPSAVVIGPICFVIDFYLLNRSARRALIAASPMLLIALPITLIARHVQQVSDVPIVSLIQRPLVALDAFTFYVSKLVWPWNLAIDYGRRPETILGRPLLIFAVIVPIVLIAILWKWRRREFIAATLIFLFALLPVLGLATFQFQQFSTVADHYLYIAMLGPAIAVAKMKRVAPVAVIIALLAIRSFLQTSYWRDDFTLLSHALSVNPHSFAAANNLGLAYQQQSSFELAYGAAANAEGDSSNARMHREAAKSSMDHAIALFRKSVELAPPQSKHFANASASLEAALKSAGELSK